MGKLGPDRLGRLRHLCRRHLPKSYVIAPRFTRHLTTIDASVNGPVYTCIGHQKRIIHIKMNALHRARVPLDRLPHCNSRHLYNVHYVTAAARMRPPDRTALAAVTLRQLSVLAILILANDNFGQQNNRTAKCVRSACLTRLIPRPRRH